MSLIPVSVLVTTARSILVLLFVVTVSLVGACAGPGGEPPVSVGASLTTTPTSTVDEVAVERVFRAYLAGVVEMENSGDLDPAPLYGLTTDEVAGEQATRVMEHADIGVHREGAPKLGDPVITVDGDEALLEVCMDQDDWIGVRGDQRIVRNDGFLPRGYLLSRSEGRWLVSGIVPRVQVKLTC